MPHCIIEYAENSFSHEIAINILETVQQTIEQCDLFDATSVRSRLLPYQDYRLGAEKSGFLHVQIKILAGRTDTQKTMVTQAVAKALASFQLDDVVFSCECSEIHKASYFK